MAAVASILIFAQSCISISADVPIIVPRTINSGPIAYCDAQNPAASESAADSLRTGIFRDSVGFQSRDAVQGVAVDASHIYAINTASITRHDKTDGSAQASWSSISKGSSVVHLNSGVVHEGHLHVAQSNWPKTPAISSVEVWNTESLAHDDSYRLPMDDSYLTWLDRHANFWWGTFADYPPRVAEYSTTTAIDPLQATNSTNNTRLVRMNDSFEILETWRYPKAMTDAWAPMSNSGGSWGPDGRLYLTDHDRSTLYVVSVPEKGSMVEWTETMPLPGIEGQGIAWDRTSDAPALYAIRRSSKCVIRVPMTLSGG